MPKKALIPHRAPTEEELARASTLNQLIVEKIAKNEDGILTDTCNQQVWNAIDIPQEFRSIWNLIVTSDMRIVKLVRRGEYSLVPSYPLGDCIESEWAISNIGYIGSKYSS